MTEEKKIEAENNELNLLIQKGVNITVTRKIRGRKGFFRFLRKQSVEPETATFTIQEPTLAVLDLLASEQINIVIDEAKIRETGLSEAKKISGEQARRMARIVAIAVLGEDYFLAVRSGHRVIYRKDEKRLAELTDLFFTSVKPSTLFQYVLLINTMSNLGDFMSSIRLMSAVRTTMPTRIEENSED